LILVAPADQFYGSILPLPSVRYCFLSAPPDLGSKRPYMDFEWLGISVSVSEFEHMDEWMPVLQARLASFNLPSTAPVATVIWAASPREVERLINAQQGVDFFMPDWLFSQLTLAGSHRVVSAPAAHVFLLSPKKSEHRPTRPCAL